MIKQFNYFLKEFFLKKLENKSFVIQKKAYVLLWVCLIFILLILTAIILNSLYPRPDSKLINIINAIIIVSIIISLILLKSGRYECSSIFISMTGACIWAAGTFIKLYGYLESGVNSYLYLMFSLMVFVSMFGTRKLLFFITLFFLITNSIFLILAYNWAEADIFGCIFSSSINIFISILVVFTFSFLLTRITSQALDITQKELERNQELNINLERKVLQRTEEIENTMLALTEANTSLIKVNNKLETTQHQMDIDMDMAVNVQQTFLHKGPPQTDEWDISFLYEPMSGVSGDLYDFFLTDNTLNGLALFDVSGHGIASGLITMMAKTVIYRNFTTRNKNSLGKIMACINRDLIHELDDIGNFLTGILLRINGNEIEYVNAGHPDILIKRNNNKKVKEIKNADQKHRGPFLGVAILEETYSTVKFKVDPGDTLIFCTDGILEGKNSNGKEFGMDRLKDSISLTPDNASAEEYINHIMKDLSLFRGNSTLKDDLTIIVCKRKISC